jgi:hypothetical protein
LFIDKIASAITLKQIIWVSHFYLLLFKERIV